MAHTNEKRAAIAAKIRALRAKTVANGCTEAEALAAIGAIEALMDKYRFEASDLDQEEAAPEKYGRGSRSGFGKAHKKSTKWHPTVRCWSMVAKMTGVKTWLQTSTGEVCAFGAEEDVLSFWYYLDLLKMASETAWTDASHLSGYSAKRAFMDGFCVGIVNKVHAIMEERRAAAARHNPERGLMRISREQLLRTKYDEYARSTGMRLRSLSGGGGGRGSQAAHSAGRAAGANVGFGGSRPSINSGARRLNN